MVCPDRSNLQGHHTDDQLTKKIQATRASSASESRDSSPSATLAVANFLSTSSACSPRSAPGRTPPHRFPKRTPLTQDPARCSDAAWPPSWRCLFPALLQQPPTLRDDRRRGVVLLSPFRVDHRRLGSVVATEINRNHHQGPVRRSWERINRSMTPAEGPPGSISLSRSAYPFYRFHLQELCGTGLLLLFDRTATKSVYRAKRCERAKQGNVPTHATHAGTRHSRATYASGPPADFLGRRLYQRRPPTPGRQVYDGVAARIRASRPPLLSATNLDRPSPHAAPARPNLGVADRGETTGAHEAGNLVGLGYAWGKFGAFGDGPC